jgi:prepilin-type N-terminal cleavage/methylation domain-containing protein
MNPSNRYRAQGYTLVEISVVLVIISLLTAGGLTLGAGMVNQAAHIDTKKLLDQIDQSLRDYHVVNGDLPCPAARNLAITHTDFGREINGGACDSTSTTGVYSGTSHSNGVRIGMVPVRALGLSDRAASDKYGNRILYAVTQKLTNAANFGTDDGAIQVLPATGAAILNNAAYFLWSAGKDHKGAPLYTTAATPNTCAGTALDAENCDNDSVFRDAPFNNGDVVASFFDDHTRWAPKFHLTAHQTQSSSLWAALGASENIFAVGPDGDWQTGNVGVGTRTPSERLSVKGNIELESDWGGTPYNMKLVGPHIVTDNPDGSLVLNFPPSGADNGLHVRSNTTAGDPGAYKEIMVVRPNGTMAIGNGLPQPYTPRATLDVVGTIRGRLDCAWRTSHVGIGWGAAGGQCAADEYVMTGGGVCDNQTHDHIAINMPWGANGWAIGCKRTSTGTDLYYPTTGYMLCCKR